VVIRCLPPAGSIPDHRALRSYRGGREARGDRLGGSGRAYPPVDHWYALCGQSAGLINLMAGDQPPG